MKLWGAYGVIQIGILLMLLVTAPMAVLAIIVVLPLAYVLMYLFARFVFGEYRQDKVQHPKN